MTAPILVVDDDPAICDTVEDALHLAGHATLRASNGDAALEIIRHQRVSLVVLDVNMPKVSGFDVLRKLRALKDATPVILLTARDDRNDVIEGFRVGADDYVTKPFAPTVLAMRVNAILRRSTSQPVVQRRVEFRNLQVDLDAQIVTVDGSPVELSRIEYNLLAALAENKGIIVGKSKLLEMVWSDWYGSDHVVDVNVSRLRQKLSAAGAPREAISTHRGRGYRFGER